MKRCFAAGMIFIMLASLMSEAFLFNAVVKADSIDEGLISQFVYANADTVLEKTGANQNNVNIHDPLSTAPLTLNGNTTGNPSWREAYMQFEVPELEGQVQGIYLHLYYSYPFAAPVGQSSVSLTSIGIWSESNVSALEQGAAGAMIELAEWDNPTAGAAKTPGGQWITVDLTGGIPAGGTFTLNLRTDATKNLTYESINMENIPYLEFVIDPAAPVPLYSIGGAVKQPNGTPLQGATIDLFRNDDEQFEHVLGQAISGEDGTFSFTASYPEGIYTARATLEGYTSAISTWTVIGQSISDAQFILNEASASEQGFPISGAALDFGAAPVAGAAVKLYTLGDVGFINPLAATTSAEDGSFALLPGFPNGSYYIEVVKSGYVSHTSMVTLNDAPIEQLQITLQSVQTAYSVTSSPANNETGVATSLESWQLVFSQPMNTESMNPATISLHMNGQPMLYNQFTSDSLHYSIVFEEPLAEAATYAVTLSTEVRTAEDAALTQPMTLSFATAKPVLPIQIDLDANAESELAPSFSGFNVNNFATAMMYNDEEVMEATKYLTPGWLRFSSGTASDAYNWKTGDYPDEWLQQFAGYGMYNTLRNYKPWIHGKGGVFLHDFEELVDYSGAKIIMVINGFTDSVESTVELAQYAKDRNLPITYWELTNEPYMFTTHSSPAAATPFFEDATDFAERMKPYCEAVKSVLPDAKCSIPFSQGEEPEWDEELGQYPDKYWDAMTFHYYTGASIDMNVEESVRKLNDALAHTTHEIIESYYKPKMPADRQDMPIIITEFNNNTRVEKSPLLRTLYNGIYVAEYVTRMSNVSNVKHVGLHVLQKDGFNTINDHTQALKAMYNAGQCTLEAPCDTTTWDFGIYPTATGLGLKIANDAVNRSTALLQTTLSGGATVPTLQPEEQLAAVHAQAYKGAEGKRYLVITNKSDQGHSGEIRLNGLPLTAAMEKYYIAGNDMTLANDETNPERLTIQTESTGNPVYIPPYSVIRLEWTEHENIGNGNGNGSWTGAVLPSLPAAAWEKLEFSDSKGRAAVKQRLSSDQLPGILQKLKSSDSAVISAAFPDEQAPVQQIELSALSIEAILESLPRAQLSIETDSADYVLPLSLLDFSSLGEQLAAQAAELMITITIAKSDPELMQQIHAAAARVGAKAAVPAVEFLVEASANGRAIMLQHFEGTYVSRSLKIDAAIDTGLATGAWYEPKTGLLRFVPTTFETGNGEVKAVLKRMGNSVYTIIEMEKTFEDIQQHRARRQIEWLASRMIVNGMSADRYAPEHSITRAEFTAMLARGLALPQQASESPFTDVAANAWYAEPISAAYRYGLINGTALDRFSPGQAITQAQAVLLAERALQMTGMALEESAFKNKLLAGIQNEASDPSSPLNRAQAAVIIKNMLVMAGLAQA